MAACVSFYFFPFRSYQFEKKGKKKLSLSLSLYSFEEERKEKFSLLFYFTVYTRVVRVPPSPPYRSRDFHEEVNTQSARRSTDRRRRIYKERNWVTHVYVYVCVCVFSFLSFLLCTK